MRQGQLNVGGFEGRKRCGIVISGSREEYVTQSSGVTDLRATRVIL